MTKIFIGNEGGKRKYKICKSCKFYMAETETLEGECLENEDIESEEFCHSYEKKERRYGKSKGRRY